MVRVVSPEPNQAEKNVDLVPRPNLTSLLGQPRKKCINYKLQCWNRQKWRFFHFTPVAWFEPSPSRLEGASTPKADLFPRPMRLVY